MVDSAPTRKALAASFIALGFYLPDHLADPWAVATLAIVGVVVVVLVGTKRQLD